MSWFDTLLYPLKWCVAWILTIFHDVFTAIGLPSDGGLTWILSIAGLTIVVRAALIPLFVYQIKAQRKMQLIQPDIQRLQAKYKGKKDQFSRQAMAEEQQALFKKHGTNPFASCLPLLIQMPIFFALYRVIYSLPAIASGAKAPIGGITQDLASQAESSQLFGIQLSDTFMTPGITVKIVTATMIIIMGCAQFYTQHQMMNKNMSEAAMNNPFMQQQKMLMYIMPIVFAIGGIYFPVGVLIYWVVSNLWTMGQQTVVLRNMPAPGSKAEKEMMERRARRGKAPLEGSKPIDMAPAPEKTSGQRQQPVSKNRQKKKKK